MRIENWYWFGNLICGVVYGHPDCEDGTVITTSAVAFFGHGHDDEGTDFILTRNSKYFLGKENEDSIGREHFGDIG